MAAQHHGNHLQQPGTTLHIVFLLRQREGKAARLTAGHNGNRVYFVAQGQVMANNGMSCLMVRDDALIFL